MRRFLITCCSALLLSQTNVWAIEAGNPAPMFELPGKTGQVKLSSLAGKVVYLDFWASWCGPCRQSFPWMNQLHAKLQRQGLHVIAVNLDANNQDAQQFLAQNPAQFTVAFDPQGATPRLYGVKGMPSSVLIGKDGKVLWQHVGFNQKDSVEIEQKIQAALEAKP